MADPIRKCVYGATVTRTRHGWLADVQIVELLLDDGDQPGTRIPPHLAGTSRRRRTRKGAERAASRLISRLEADDARRAHFYDFRPVTEVNCGV